MHSALVYSGPSMLTGAPIVAIASGLKRKSANRKTGDMVQVWILPDPNAGKPTEHSANGTDDAVCGECPLRWFKGGACYVNIGQAPQSVASAYLRGNVPEWDGAPFKKPVRIGAYGDPAALPEHVVSALVNAAGSHGHTAYSHQWARPNMEWLSKYAMASVETAAQRDLAWARGWRTFRVTDSLDGMDAHELECLADRGLADCASCKLCDGAKGGAAVKSIAIKVHGSRSSRF